MLFDRLVFPVPQTPRFPENSGPPDKIGPIEWIDDPDEWRRWDEAIPSWNPARQKELLQLLAPVIRKIPWKNREEEYRLEAAKLAAEGVPDYAFVATRTTLTRDLPAYVTGVAAIGPAYRTMDAIECELKITVTGQRPRLPGSALANVLAWKFFAPDPHETKLSDESLLERTVKFVTENDDFRQHRTAFVEWQQKFLQNEVTDRESIGYAIDEMRDLLEKAKKTTARLSLRTAVRYAFRIAPAAVGLGVALAGAPGGLAAAAGGVFLSVGGIAVDEKLFKNADKGNPPPTAFVYDARRHFGWT
jgi:hypothetical protein